MASLRYGAMCLGRVMGSRSTAMAGGSRSVSRSWGTTRPAWSTAQLPLSCGRRFYAAKPTDEVPGAEGDTAEGVEIPNFQRETVDEQKFADNPEQAVGSAEQFGFQAETKKLLDIVARSLYTDKEVFIRELISNASDALEKLRHKNLSKPSDVDTHLNFEISMTTDEATNTFTIQDYGIGMTKDELIENLGTIAHSGSGKFVKDIEEGSLSAQDIIGQFGVGFYSVFMVADKVTVFSKSAVDGKSYIWESDGMGQYTISEAEGLGRGCKIVLHLKRGESTFSKKMAVENIIKKYSNFVNFPISLNGERVNTVEALWCQPKNSISEEQHKEFYQFISGAYDEPRYCFQYATDSPLHIQSLFYVPDQHSEKYGMGPSEPGVALYCRRVLIQAKCKGLLPDWLRFIKGVVDSEDIPLNLSREHLQDSALISRLSTVLTRRVLKFLADEAKADREKYLSFFKEYENFLKAGICTDMEHKDEIAKLLRVESSALPPEDRTSLDEYISRAKDDSDIYFLHAPSRAYAESSPYFESFRKKGIEVIFFTNMIDEYMMNNMRTYKGHKMVSIESVEAMKASEDEEKDTKDETVVKDFSKWIREALEDKVSTVRESNRLINSPALVADNDSNSMRRVMHRMDPTNAPRLPKQVFEYNINHPIMNKINVLRYSDDRLARTCLEQVFDNALISAGLLADPRTMVGRLNVVLEKALDGSVQKTETSIDGESKKKVLDAEFVE